MPTLGLALHLPCPKCVSPIPVGALVERLTCDACQADVAPTAFLEKMASEAFWSRLLLRGPGGRLDELGLEGEMVWAEPRCPGCEATFALPASLEDAAARGHLDCPKCGKPVVVRRVPRGLVPDRADYLSYLVGEEAALLPGAAGSAAPSGAVEPILFTCPQCSASLPVDGSDRTVECSYCHASLFLPDALWRRLHPVRTISRWSVVVDPDSPRARSYRRANRLNSWSILFTWAFFFAAVFSFVQLGGLLRWLVGGAFAAGWVLWFLIGIRWHAQSEGSSWP